MKPALTSQPEDFGETEMKDLFDVRIFNSYAPLKQEILFEQHLQEARRCEEENIRSTYNRCGIVLSLTGGTETNQCYKKLASMLSTKWNHPYTLLPWAG